MGGLVNGDLDDEDVKTRAMDRARERGYLSAEDGDE